MSTNKETYEAIKEFIKVHRYSPSVRELGSILNLSSPASVKSRINKLAQKGYITYEPNKSRTLKIVKEYEND